jgi:hypothetical protein
MLHRSSFTTVAATLALAAAASAQVGTFYTFTQTAGTYFPITGGTLIATATAANTLDDNTFPVTLPFPFTYDNAVQTQVQVQTNGHLSFGATSPGTTYTPISATGVTPGYVAACGRDLQGGYVFAGSRTIGSDQLTGVSSNGPLQVGDVLVATGIPTGATILAISGSTITMSAPSTTAATNAAVTAYGPWSEMRWETVGSSPNQIFIVQWSNFRRFGTGLTVNNGTRLNFQIHLHEDGRIMCVYGDCSPGVTGVTTTALHQVGLRGPTNAFPANVNNRLNTKGVNDDWSLSVAGTANTSSMLFNAVAPANVIPNGLTYEWAPPVGVIATNTTLGVGCGAAANSFFELFATAAPAATALSGNALQLNPNGNGGFQGVWLAGAAGALFHTPVAPTTLATGDDGTVPYTISGAPVSTPEGAQTSLQVSGNGIVAWGAGVMDFPGTNSFTPTAGGFLNGLLGGVYSWHDYNQSEVGSGAIVADEDANTVYITFQGVESYASPEVLNPSTLQFQLDRTGTIRIVWVSIDGNSTSTFGSAHLVGVTSPGASQAVSSITLATAGFPQLNTVNPEVLPMTLTASNRPVQLATPSSWDLVVSNVPPATVLGVDLFGLGDPGILDLGPFGLGKAGCQLRASLDILNVWVAAGATHNYSFAIPPSPNLNNFHLFTQSVSLGNGSFADNITSNGIDGKFGNL